MTHGSLFSGIGGFDLAARWAGFENIFQVEIDPFCQKVLAKNFPETKKYLDIKEFNGEEYRGRIDVISGGFPCQDISIAGVNNGRKGLDGSRSGLFYEMLRIIGQINPLFIFYENSPHLIHWITTIHNELTKLGYKNYGKKFTAREFGFPHKRERYYGFSFANTISLGLNEIEIKIRECSEKCKSDFFGGAAGNKASINRAFSYSLQTPSNSEFLRTFDGIPSKLDANRVHALGNAIVPQIAYILFETINQLTPIEE